MLHILHGPDSFSRAEALTALKRSLDTDGMLLSNTNVLDAKSLTFAHLVMVCGAAPFLAANRLVITDGLLARLGGRGGGRRRGKAAGPKLPEEWAGLPAAVAAMPPTTTLVLLDGALPEDSALLDALAEHGRVRAFPKLPPRSIEGWIVQRAKSARLTLEPGAAALLAQSASPDVDDAGQWHALWGLANDLEKLALYAGGRAIGVADVQALVSSAADTNIFAFVDAVLDRRGDDALRRLTDLLEAGQPPPVVLTMIVRGYRELALYTDLSAAGLRPEEIGRRLNVPGWKLRPLTERARRYQPERLAAIYDRLLRADRSVKRGETDERTALELLTAELAAVS
jgi:DNA polymerase-3 subunit delta